MDYQYIEVPKKYISYMAELRNPEGTVIRSTRIIQKNKNSDDRMMKEVALANRITSKITPTKMAQISQTFAAHEYTYEFIMN